MVHIFKCGSCFYITLFFLLVTLFPFRWFVFFYAVSSPVWSFSPPSWQESDPQKARRDIANMKSRSSCHTHSDKRHSHHCALSELLETLVVCNKNQKVCCGLWETSIIADCTSHSDKYGYAQPHVWFCKQVRFAIRESLVAEKYGQSLIEVQFRRPRHCFINIAAIHYQFKLLI